MTRLATYLVMRPVLSLCSQANGAGNVRLGCALLRILRDWVGYGWALE